MVVLGLQFTILLKFNMLVNFSFCVLTLLYLQVEGNVIPQNDSVLEATKEICMKELGCFSITSDFKSLLNRPINVLPNDRAVINTRFLLYTKKHVKQAHQLVAGTKSTIDKSDLNPNNPVIFIVHGFMDSEFFGQWMQNMKDEFLLGGDNNIIIVDWSKGNKPPYYQATANTRVVGAEIAVLIEALEKHKGVKRENCHIVGHSLGAHIAGYAGLRLKKLGRITGCDPAEPYFKNMPASVRLDSTDAQFVDVIHSDATDSSFIGFGISQNVGHVDFYPNNGKKQPGCIIDKFTSFITDGLKEGVRRFGSCNHQRSLDFFHHSINDQTITPVGFECKDWQDFQDGKCADCGSDTKKCAILGMRAIEYKKFKNDKVHHEMYLQTSAKPPFWMYHYQVTVKLFKPRSVKDVSGTVDVTLFGTKADALFTVQRKAADFKHGSTYQYLVTTEKEIGDLKSVSIIWFSSSWNPLNIINKPLLHVEYIRVIPMNSVEKPSKNFADKTFCDKPADGIPPKTVRNLYKDKPCKA